MLYQDGVDVKTIQAIIGHADINTTMNTYVHANDSKKQECMKKLGDMLTAWLFCITKLISQYHVSWYAFCAFWVMQRDDINNWLSDSAARVEQFEQKKKQPYVGVAIFSGRFARL